jgi:O-antigen/teichoic acid export membrane protein
MGVIRRQSLKHSAVNVAAMCIGGLSIFFVYPHALEAYGLFQVLAQVGMVGLPLLSLGANTVAIRFFPRFQDKASGHHGFLPLLFGLCAVGFALTAFGVLLAALIVPQWWDVWAGRTPLLRQYVWVALPLAFFYVIGTVLSVYSANFKRIVIPSVLFDFSQKIVQPLLIIAVWKQWLPLGAAVAGLLLHAIVVAIGLALYLRRLGEWHWRPAPGFLTPGLRRELLQFIGFGAFGGFALQMASKVDILMVGLQSSLTSAAIYSIAAYIASTIDIPTRSLYTASASSVARYIADHDRPALASLYRKVSINLLISGLLVFGAVWVSIDRVYYLLANGQIIADGKNVLLLIGMSRIVEMATGLNNYLIYYSRYYRLSLVSLGLCAVLNVAANIVLIPRFGLEGPALATLLSVTGYNTFSLLLVWFKMRLQPFTLSTLTVFFLAGISYTVAASLPHSSWPLFDIALHSGAYVVIFGALVVRLQVSPDLSEVAAKALAIVRRR